MLSWLAAAAPTEPCQRRFVPATQCDESNIYQFIQDAVPN